MFLGELVSDFISKNKIENLDFIASHGHTIYHDPGQNYTLQIGSGAHLASRSGVKVICDFRVQDDFGGSVRLLDPGEDLINFAKQVLEQCPKIPSYARVDICQSAKGPLLMELELIEPELWFRLYPPAVESMINAII